MILVTGATGKIGQGLRKLLLDNQIAARLLTRKPENAADLKGSKVEVVQGDFKDPSSIASALKGVDKLFLNIESTEGSVGWANETIAAAKTAGVKHIVRLSVLGADAGSPVTLARWHAETEATLKASGIPWTILRPGMFMQNVLASAHSLKSDGAFYGVAKEGKVPQIDARDIAAAALKTLTSDGHAGKTYTLTGPVAFNPTEQAEMLSKALARPIKYIAVPEAQFRASLASAGLPAWLVDDYVTMAAFGETGAAAAIAPDLATLIGKVRTYEEFAREVAAPALK